MSDNLLGQEYLGSWRIILLSNLRTTQRSGRRNYMYLGGYDAFAEAGLVHSRARVTRFAARDVARIHAVCAWALDELLGDYEGWPKVRLPF